MTESRKILVTGSTGFVGQRLCVVLREKGFGVREAARCPQATGTEREIVTVGEIDSGTDWGRSVEGVNSIIHLAGRAHVMRESAADPMSEFRRINVAGTERLAVQTAAAGVRRLVFVSSIGVNGSTTTVTPFSESDPPRPHSPYSMSKWEAEQRLREIERQTGLEIVIVRPPLVYGPGAKGNFLSLLKWVKRGAPLPLGACTNKRTLVGLDNLVDLLVRCVSHPAAAGQTFLAGDGEDLSTPELIRRVASALGRRARLIAVPPVMLKAAARAVGRGGIYEQLCGSLQVDIGHARRVLGWEPPVSIDEELARAAQWFKSQGAKA